MLLSRGCTSIIILSIVLTQLSFAGEKGLQKRQIHVPTRANALNYVVQGFTMKMWMDSRLILGKSAWSSYTSSCPDLNIGLEYPIGSCMEHLYGAGPMLGGIVRGVRFVAQAYNTTHAYGYFIPSMYNNERIIREASRTDTGYDVSRAGYYKRPPHKLGIDDDGDGRIDEEMIDGIDNDNDWSRDKVTHQYLYTSEGYFLDDIGTDGLRDEQEVGCLGVYDPVRNPDPASDNYDTTMIDVCRNDTSAAGHPVKDNTFIYTQNNGLPDYGEPHVDEDYGAISDHDIFIAVTDTVPQSENPSRTSVPLKIIMKSYAWERDILEPFIPIEYSFINIGRDTIKDVYIGMDIDADIYTKWNQSPDDNYSASIPELRLGYTHNPENPYSTPLGVMILDAPTPLEDLQFVFLAHDFNTPCGEYDEGIYSCMSCQTLNFRNCIGENQSPLRLNDSKFMLSIGNKQYNSSDTSTWHPYQKMKSFGPGDTLTFTVAFVSGDDVSSSKNSLKANAEKALMRYQRNFKPAVVPPSPCMKIETDSLGVKLRWGAFGGIECQNPVETWDDSNRFAEWRFGDTDWRRHNPPPGHTKGGRIFEGYNVYRSEDPEGLAESFSLIKQFDVVDGMFYDIGLDTTWNDRNVRRGNSYWYAVTSFAIPDAKIVSRVDPDNPNHRIQDTIFADIGLESSIMANAQKVYVPFATSHKLGTVKVVPNPYYGNRAYTERNGYEGSDDNWSVWKRMVRFINLPAKATIRIYTIAGEVIHTIYHDEDGGSKKGQEDYLLLSESNKALAPGIFVFTVESELGTQTGKFVVIY